MKKKNAEDQPSRRRVGRPGIGGTEPLLVRVLPGTAARIDAISGPGKRSEFVREAIAREIARRGEGEADGD